MTLIPKAWRPFVKGCAHPSTIDTDLTAWALRLMASDKVMSARKSERSRPQRHSDSTAKADRKMQEIRLREMLRHLAEERCESCRVPTYGAGHAHHLISGPLRVVKEAPDTMVHVCARCHDMAHQGDLGTLQTIREIGRLSTEAQQAVQRRIDKINRVRST